MDAAIDTVDDEVLPVVDLVGETDGNDLADDGASLVGALKDGIVTGRRSSPASRMTRNMVAILSPRSPMRRSLPSKPGSIVHTPVCFSSARPKLCSLRSRPTRKL